MGKMTQYAPSFSHNEVVLKLRKCYLCTQSTSHTCPLMSLSPVVVSVLRLRKETKDAIRVVFNSPEGLSYESGQFLTLLVQINNKEYRRCYSFCSVPEDPLPAIIIKRVEGGVVSNFLHDTLKVGQVLGILPAMGHFTTQYVPHQQRCYVLIAGGSGITPLFSLARSLLTKEPDCELLLIYGNKSKRDTILASEIDELAQNYAKRFQLQHVWEQGPSKGAHLLGQLELSQQLRILASYSEEKLREAIYFLCGPAPMREASGKALRSLNISPDQIHEESFLITEQIETEEISSQRYHVDLRLLGEQRRIQVDAEQTILEAGIDSGLDMPYSCQRGICSACRGKLLAGQIQYKSEPAALSEEEIAQGYILCCVARPVSDLVLEVEEEE